MFSRTLSSPTKPSALRSSGQKATPLCSAWRVELWAIGLPRMVRCPGIGADRSEHQLGGLGAARTQQTGQSDNLARTQGQVERLHGAPAPKTFCDHYRLARCLPNAARPQRLDLFEPRPIIIEISFTCGSSAVSASPTRRPLRNTEMRSEIW